MSLSLRAVAIQGIGFSPIHLAVQGLLDYIAGGGETRRPKSTNTLKLRRIAEGKAWLVGSKAVARAHTVQAKGHVPEIVELPAAPGRAAAMSGSCKSVSRKVRATGASSCRVVGGMATSRCTPAHSIAAARVTCAQARSSVSVAAVFSAGGGRTTAMSSSAVSVGSYAEARGTRNLTTLELVAISRVIIDKRR